MILATLNAHSEVEVRKVVRNENDTLRIMALLVEDEACESNSDPDYYLEVDRERLGRDLAQVELQRAATPTAIGVHCIWGDGNL